MTRQSNEHPQPGERPDHARLVARARTWLEEDPDPVTAAELEGVLAGGDDAALRERFSARLEFGTAGIRGVLGAGPGRMNRALVRRVTAGLARYLLQVEPEAATRGVVVGRDGRRLSPELAADTAAVLAGAGIPAHAFPDVVPTPVCAYAVEALGAAAGVVVTASHNPPEYNGYKVYWSNAAQIIPPHDRGISAAIDAIGSIRSVPFVPADAAARSGLLHEVPERVIEGYFRDVLALRRRPGVGTDLRIVYTPLHGVGWPYVSETLARAGFENVFVVPEQRDPDPEFPTVRFPNPEEEGAMDHSLALAAREGADLVLANDPDADRLAVIVPSADGYRPLTGNQIGLCLAYYLLTESPPPGEPVVMTTVVSSSLLEKMASELGAHYAETLTGFKWIANRALQLREEKGYRFEFGFEEALGYSVGELVRDKDGVGAALIFAELAAVCRSRGRTVLEYLESIFRRFGLYTSEQRSVTLPGSQGRAQIEGIMEGFRAEPPPALGRAAVTAFSDLGDGRRRDVKTGAETTLDLPRSNVLVYELEDGSRVLLRPSGTEPKIKYYFEIVESMRKEELFSEAEARSRKRMQELIETFLTEVGRRVSGDAPGE